MTDDNARRSTTRIGSKVEDRDEALARLSRMIGEAKAAGEDASALIAKHRQLSQSLQPAAVGEASEKKKPARCTVRAIREREGFRELADRWDRLIMRSDGYSPFTTWEWMYSWYEGDGRDLPLFILAVERDGELQAVAPLMVDRGSAHTAGRHLRMIGTGNRVVSDLLDLPMAKEDQDGDWQRELWSYLFDDQDVADVVVLEHFDVASEGLRALRTAALEHGWVVLETSSKRRVYGELPQTWEEFVEHVPSSHRRKYLRALDRKLPSMPGNPQREEFGDPQEIKPLLRELSGFSIERFGVESAWADPVFQSTMLSTVERMGIRGWVAMERLKVKDETAALLLGLRFRGTHFAYQPSFSESAGVERAGHVLFALSIRHAIASGMKRYDFLGEHDYMKQYFTTASPLVDVVLARPKAASLRQVGGRLWAKGTRGQAKAFLGRFRRGGTSAWTPSR